MPLNTIICTLPIIFEWGSPKKGIGGKGREKEKGEGEGDEDLQVHRSESQGTFKNCQHSV